MFSDSLQLQFQEYCDQHTAALPDQTALLPQESHPEREMLLVLAGEMEFYLAGRRYMATPGKAFFIDHWITHPLGYSKVSTIFRHIWVHVHSQRLFAMLGEMAPDGTLQSCGMWEFPHGMLELLNQRWDRAGQADAELRLELYESIVRMLTEEIHFQQRIDVPMISREDDVISWVKNYISMNYGRNSSLEELERLTGYNRRHLMRKFKSENHITIGEYINCVRRGFVSDAQQRMSQKEIAFQLGFKSAAAYWLWQQRDRRKYHEQKL